VIVTVGAGREVAGPPDPPLHAAMPLPSAIAAVAVRTEMARFMAHLPVDRADQAVTRVSSTPRALADRLD
jgi:hypothetical protein